MNFQQGVPAFPSQGNFQGSPQMIPAMPGNWQQGSSSHSSQTPSVFNPQAPPQSGGFNPHVQTGFNAQGQPGFNPQGASFGYHQQAPQGAMPPPPPISAALPSKFFPGN